MQAAASLMGNLRRTGGLEGTLRKMMLEGAGTPRRLKTFAVELNGMENPTGSSYNIRWDSRPTGIDGVTVITCRDGGGELPECELVLDRRLGRFCLLHTAEEDAVAERAVALMAHTTALNRAWVCPSVLARMPGSVARANGRGARGTVRMENRSDDGSAAADVRCDGMVSHAGGESVGAHLRTAGDVLAASALMCVNAERFRIDAVDTPEGPRFDLRPIDIRLSREIEDIPAFVGRTFDGSLPLLMEGSAIHMERDQYHVPVADIECWHYFGMDIAPEFIGVGIHGGCSGSGVPRLLSYLQMHHDPNLSCGQVIAGACRE